MEAAAVQWRLQVAVDFDHSVLPAVQAVDVLRRRSLPGSAVELGDHLVREVNGRRGSCV